MANRIRRLQRPGQALLDSARVNVFILLKRSPVVGLECAEDRARDAELVARRRPEDRRSDLLSTARDRPLLGEHIRLDSEVSDSLRLVVKSIGERRVVFQPANLLGVLEPPE